MESVDIKVSLGDRHVEITFISDDEINLISLPISLAKQLHSELDQVIRLHDKQQQELVLYANNEGGGEWTDDPDSEFEDETDDKPFTL